MNRLDAGRLRREWRTLDAMIAITCRGRGHERPAEGRRALCPACAELRAYAEQRLLRCPFGETKPTCNHCRVHCYRPEMRERVREVMRYAGPKMLLRHPVLALLHLVVDDRRPAPERPIRRREPTVAPRESATQAESRPTASA